MAEETRDLFPSPDTSPQEKEKQLDLILAQTPGLSHALIYDEKGLVYRTQPQLSDKYIREEHEHNPESYRVWFSSEGQMMVEDLHKKPLPIAFSKVAPVKRAGGDAFTTTAFFILPQVSNERTVLGGVTFEGCYLRQNLFPGMLEEMVNQKSAVQSGNQIAMVIYLANT